MGSKTVLTTTAKSVMWGMQRSDLHGMTIGETMIFPARGKKSPMVIWRPKREYRSPLEFNPRENALSACTPKAAASQAAPRPQPARASERAPGFGQFGGAGTEASAPKPISLSPSLFFSVSLSLSLPLPLFRALSVCVGFHVHQFASCLACVGVLFFLQPPSIHQAGSWNRPKTPFVGSVFI